MPWVVRLYLLGLFLSLFSALFGLVGFLGDLMPLQGDPGPSLSGPWMMGPQGRGEGGGGGLPGTGGVRTNKAVGSFP